MCVCVCVCVRERERERERGREGGRERGREGGRENVYVTDLYTYRYVVYLLYMCARMHLLLYDVLMKNILMSMSTDLRKRFQRIPMSSRVAVKETTELQCLPPEGKPLPTVSVEVFPVNCDVCV